MSDRHSSNKHTPRRIILLSSVAGLAVAGLIAGPAGYFYPTQCPRGVSPPKLRNPPLSP
jgi:hypothetical protein